MNRSFVPGCKGFYTFWSLGPFLFDNDHFTSKLLKHKWLNNVKRHAIDCFGSKCDKFTYSMLLLTALQIDIGSISVKGHSLTSFGITTDVIIIICIFSKSALTIFWLVCCCFEVTKLNVNQILPQIKIQFP